MKRSILVLLTTFLCLSARDSKYDIRFFGADEASFAPDTAGKETDALDDSYDVVIAGGGLAGLTSAIFLTKEDSHKKVLLLEKEKHLGGLAAGRKVEGLEEPIYYDHGAAYWTDPTDEQSHILKEIGLDDFSKHEIHAPIDSYLWDGKLYVGMWEDEEHDGVPGPGKETMEILPQSFNLFRFELSQLNDEGGIANQPIENASKEVLKLDALSALQWIESMPARVKKRAENRSRRKKDIEIAQKAREIYDAFVESNEDPRRRKINYKDHNGMGDVVRFLTLYSRSALGSPLDKISTLAFANFYISEIVPRYTTPIGTGLAAKNMMTRLKQRKDLWNYKLQATVTKMTNQEKDSNCPVKTEFLANNKVHTVCSKYAVYAGQLKFAPKVIPELKAKAPEKYKILMDQNSSDYLRYSHYSVHALILKGHPFRTTYDTWVYSTGQKDDHYTDMILGRWMDKSIQGYKKEPKDDVGIMTVYHPLPQRYIDPNGKGYTDDLEKVLAEEAADQAIAEFTPHSKEKINVRFVETSKWPYSVHVASPGHFSERAPILRKPVGKILFAHSNIGTPAFEEAMFRGHCAAVNIRRNMEGRSYDQTRDKWTRTCPKDLPLKD